MPCKKRGRTPRNRFWLYHPCTASFGTGSLTTGRSGGTEEISTAPFEAILSYGDSDLVGGHFFQPPEGIRVFSHEENQSCCLSVRFRALVPTFLAFVG
jgi:hypothetical protein